MTNITETKYFPDGNVSETTGAQTYRVTYTYDYADRKSTMTTYGTETATTTWLYDPQRGWLTEKNYHGETDNPATPPPPMPTTPTPPPDASGPAHGNAALPLPTTMISQADSKPQTTATPPPMSP